MGWSAPRCMRVAAPIPRFMGKHRTLKELKEKRRVVTVLYGLGEGRGRKPTRGWEKWGHVRTCTRNSVFTLRLASCSPSPPRDPHRESISSMKIVEGAKYLAIWNRIFTCGSRAHHSLVSLPPLLHPNEPSSLAARADTPSPRAGNADAPCAHSRRDIWKPKTRLRR